MPFRKSSNSLIDQATELAERAAPHVEHARDKVVDEYLPLAQQVLADARETAAPAAAAAVANARERLPEQLGGTPPKKSRGKKLLALLGVVGLGAVAAKVLAGRNRSEPIPSYTPPTPAPAPAAPVTTPADDAGADPAEALADQSEAPHRATTPDDPAELIDVSDVPDPKA